MESIRPEVAWFSSKMEEELLLNDFKGGWKDCEVQWLIKRLQDEVDELKSEWYKRENDWGRSADEGYMFVKSNEDLIKECADISNFAMMIADNLK